MTVDERAAFDRSAGLLPGRRESDRLWLGVGLGAGVLAYLAYLLTHPYPAYAAGLFLVMAEQVSAHDYGLPTTIPYYTETGVPFAYPPLMFYVTAAVHDLTGVSWLAFARYLPGLAVVAYLVPYYGIAREFLGTPRRAGLATVLFATTPTVLRWHLSAGGFVRAVAMLLALAGVYAGLELFRERDRRWLAPAVVLFGLTVLTHPTYTVFFGLSYLLLYACYDRSRRGLLAGAAVAAGGLALASPWWLAVIARHGVDIFLTASGTHSGLGGGLWRLAVKLGYGLDDLNVESAVYVAAYLGGLYALVRGRYVLPAWAVASSYVIGKNRFLFVAGSMLSAAFVFDAVMPTLRDRFERPRRQDAVVVATVVVVVLAASAVGVLYAASALRVAHTDSPSQPQSMDQHDRAAMAWAAGHTAPDDAFVVLGDPGEWLPLYAERTILLGPWGWEWKETSGYYRELERYDAVATCDTAACLSTWLDRLDRDPEYVYVPKGAYTVRGKHFERDPGMRASMLRSERYELAYENPGGMLFRVEDSSTTATARSPTVADSGTTWLESRRYAFPPAWSASDRISIPSMPGRRLPLATASHRHPRPADTLPGGPVGAVGTTTDGPGWRG